jgi:hypothetical protein
MSSRTHTHRCTLSSISAFNPDNTSAAALSLTTQASLDRAERSAAVEHDIAPCTGLVPRTGALATVFGARHASKDARELRDVNDPHAWRRSRWNVCSHPSRIDVVAVVQVCVWNVI